MVSITIRPFKRQNHWIQIFFHVCKLHGSSMCYDNCFDTVYRQVNIKNHAQISFRGAFSSFDRMRFVCFVVFVCTKTRMCLNEKENAHFILFLFIAISINSFTNLYYTLDIISVRVCVCVSVWTQCATPLLYLSLPSLFRSAVSTESFTCIKFACLFVLNVYVRHISNVSFVT